MRVVAFWAALVALVVMASQGAIVALSLLAVSVPQNVVAIIYQVAAAAQIVLSALLAIFFFGYAVTKRDS